MAVAAQAVALAEFPAHAGMNRWPRTAGKRPARVPRTRGDEPMPGLRRWLGDRGVPRTRGDEPSMSKHTCPSAMSSPHTRG